MQNTIKQIECQSLTLDAGWKVWHSRTQDFQMKIGTAHMKFENILISK